ncbi:hypothetical protein [Onishia taeanensis]
MNRFKRHLLAISLISSIALPLAATAASPADAHPPQDQHPGQHMEQMAALNLSDDQRDALTKAHQSFREERQALREQQRGAIDEILTEEQRARLDAAREARHDGKQRHEQRQARMQERLDALYASWSLSDDDRATLSDAHQTLMDQRRALHQEAFDSREDRQAAVEALRAEHEQALAEVLNEEQRHALAVLMAPHHHKHPRGHHGHQAGEHRDGAHGDHHGEHRDQPDSRDS